MFDIQIDLPDWTGYRRSYTTGHFKWFNFLRWGKINKTRGWEFQLDYWGWHNLLQLSVSLDTKGVDHAGPRFVLCVLGFTAELSFPDSRHWNYQENRFYLDSEEHPDWDDPDSWRVDEEDEVETGGQSA